VANISNGENNGGARPATHITMRIVLCLVVGVGDVVGEDRWRYLAL
jgi:hypothetical protein